MKNKLIITTVLLLMGMLIGCGKMATADKEEDIEQSPVADEIILSQNIQQILELENKRNTEGLSIEEYHALAELYSSEGYILYQRDLLEQCYRLWGDEESLILLKDIQVNAEEENQQVLGVVEFLLTGLCSEASYVDVMERLSDSETLSILLPKPEVKVRRYYYTDKNGDTLYFEIEYINSEYLCKASLLKQNNELVMLNKIDSQVQLFSGGYKDSYHNGAFILWSLDGDKGIISKEEGTLEKDNLKGDYTISVYNNKDISLVDLWNNRSDYNYDAFTGNFDDNGKTSMEQPKIKSYADSIAYAYDKTGKTCIYIDKEDVTDGIFGVSFLKISAIPSINTYDVKEPIQLSSKEEEMAQVPKDEVKVRVFDGIVQWYDGVSWNNVGTVSELAEKDPFAADLDEKNIMNNTDAPEDSEEAKKSGDKKKSLALAKSISVGSAVETKAKSNSTQQAVANGAITAGGTASSAHPSGGGATVSTDNGYSGGDNNNSSGGNPTNSGGNASGGGGTDSPPPAPSTPDPPADSGGGDSGGGDSGGGDSSGDTDSDFSAEVD